MKTSSHVLLFIRDILKSSHVNNQYKVFDLTFENVRLVGLVVQVTETSFLLDDGSGVIQVDYSPQIISIYPGMCCQIIGFLTENVKITCVGLSACSLMQELEFQEYAIECYQKFYLSPPAKIPKVDSSSEHSKIIQLLRKSKRTGAEIKKALPGISNVDNVLNYLESTYFIFKDQDGAYHLF
jgi:hypothetical protein